MRVAIVKLSSIGDVVHALPVAVALKRARPSAHVTWVAEAREAALLTNHPDVDDVVVADTRGWRRRPRAVALREAWALARTLRGRFDVVLDLQGLLKSGVITALTRAPQRIGFAAGVSRERLNAWFTNVRVRPPRAAQHVVEQYLALLTPLGVSHEAVEFRVPVDADAATRVEHVLADAGVKPQDRLVVINPGAGRPEKRWPPERFAELTRRLGPAADARIVVLWGPGEERDAEAIASAEGGAVRAPATTLRELTALVRRARLMIAADTGPLHVAAAVGTPCVGLFGPTSGVRNGPYGPGHRVLQGAEGRVAAVTVDAVLGAATGLLERIA